MLSTSEEAMTDYPLASLLSAHIKAAYRKTFYDKEMAETCPNMRVAFVAGECGPAWTPAAMWAVEEEKALGCVRVTTRLVPGANHLVRFFFRSVFPCVS